jgi:predicted nucleotidyltransferase
MDKINIKNREKLHGDVAKKFIPFLTEMVRIHDDNIVSVFIYGSAACDNYIPKVSDINSVFIFREIDFRTLENSLSVVSKGISRKIEAPLFLTEEYIKTSLDVFPIEFVDMKENHTLLYGADVLSALKINGEHIRLFCEQQIKGKLVRIRQAYLEVGSQKKGQESLLKESLNSLIPIFRNLIRLKGQEPSIKKEEIIIKLCELFNLEKNVFLPVYKDTANDEKIAGKDVKVFLEKYIEQISILARMVDEI